MDTSITTSNTLTINPREFYLPIIKHKISVFLGVQAGRDFCLNLLVEQLKNDPELTGNVDPYWIGRNYVAKILKEYGCQRHHIYTGRDQGRDKVCYSWRQLPENKA